MGISDVESHFYNSGMNYVGMQYHSDGYLYTDTNNGGTQTQTREFTYSSSFQNVGIAWNQGSAKFYRDGSLIREYTSNVPTSADSLHVLFRDVQAIDWVFVRKAAVHPPAIVAWANV